jgi:hypothetical protein
MTTLRRTLQSDDPLAIELYFPYPSDEALTTGKT